LIFSLVAAASLSSGVLQDTVGWAAVNAAIALPMMIAFTLTVWFKVAQGGRAEAK